MERKKLGELLIEAGALSEAALASALKEQRRWGGSLGRMLVDMKLVGEDELVRVLSRQLGLAAVDLDARVIDPAVLALVPSELAQQFTLVPFAKTATTLDLAMADPTNLGIVDELRLRTQLAIVTYLAGPKMIERALAAHYGHGRRPAVPEVTARDIEIAALQERISTLEAAVARDEQLVRNLLALLVDRGVVTRDDVLDKLR